MNNVLKTTLLLGALTGLLLAAGYLLGGNDGLVIALLLSVAMNAGSYWFSDKLVLSLYRAKEATPEQAPQLFSAVRLLAAAEGLPMPRVYIVDMPVPNAFATGRDPKHAAVAVSRSLLELLDERELKGVLAHELAHVRNRDILVSSVAATLAGALSVLAHMAYYTGGRGRDDRGANPAAAMVLVLLSPLIASLLHMAVSRAREFHADETGAKVTGDPEALASALLKLDSWTRQRPLRASPGQEAAAHLFIVNPFRASALQTLFSTHPSTEERVRRLRAMR